MNRLLVFGIVLALGSAIAHSFAKASATFVIDSQDPAGIGLNDSTPAAPVGGNSGTTVGEQRLIAVQYAADIWGGLLNSKVPIVVQVSFLPLPCTADTADLGQAAPYNAARNIMSSNADPAVFYPAALASRLAGRNLFPGDPDIVAEFNGAIGASQCMPDLKWYYGLDGDCGADVDLASVVLHELGHGLGFTNFVDMETGALADGRADIYTKYTFDTAIGKHWSEMSDAERLASAANVRRVVWDGPNATAQAPGTLASGAPLLEVTPAPAGFSGLVSEANFGPLVSSQPVQAELALGNPSDGCRQLGGETSGKVALMFEGACHFGDTIYYAQSDGALAVLLARNAFDGSPPAPLDADGPTAALLNNDIHIPSLSIARADANLLKTALESGKVTVNLTADPDQLVGADASGRVFLNATDPLDNFSSIVHWDALTRPNLLMEPTFVDTAFHHDVDLSLALLKDIGWFPVCGNGQLDKDEECDQGIDDSDSVPDACRTNCVKAFCGDAVKDSAEQCDNGSGNSDTVPDACRTNCASAKCGDGVKDTGEQCDNGEDNADIAPAACSASCRLNAWDGGTEGGATRLEAGGAGSGGAGSGAYSDANLYADSGTHTAIGDSAVVDSSMQNANRADAAVLSSSRAAKTGCGCRVAGGPGSERSGVINATGWLVLFTVFRRKSAAARRATS